MVLRNTEISEFSLVPTLEFERLCQHLQSKKTEVVYSSTLPANTDDESPKTRTDGPPSQNAETDPPVEGIAPSDLLAVLMLSQMKLLTMNAHNASEIANELQFNPQFGVLMTSPGQISHDYRDRLVKEGRTVLAIHEPRGQPRAVRNGLLSTAALLAVGGLVWVATVTTLAALLIPIAITVPDLMRNSIVDVS